jgi:hypothetical protein
VGAMACNVLNVQARDRRRGLHRLNAAGRGGAPCRFWLVSGCCASG